MRKRFFKKLSLGMALALVLGTTAHAGVAQAAEATWTLKKNSATVYLNEDNVKGTPDNYDFNFKNKPENWKKDYSFNWYSENEEVATVAKGGVVTGVSVGEATIVCEIVNKKTFEVENVKAKVTVKANAADVEITNAAKYDAEEGVIVNTGAVIDLNRAMYDENGNKTTKRGVYVTDYTRWYVLDENGVKVGEDVATVNQKNGQFVINKAGVYGLVCETYQSTKNDQAIVNDFVMVNVVDAAPVIDAKQTTVTKFELDLATPIAKGTLDNGKNEEALMDLIDVVLELEGDDKYVMPIKNIEAVKGFTAEDGSVSKVEITMWDRFEDGKTYTVGKKVEKSITDAEENKDMTKVVYEATDEFVACVGRPDEIEVSIVNPTLSRKDTVDDVVYVTDKVEYQDFDLKFIAHGPEGDIDVTEVYFDTDKEVLLTDGDLVGELKAVSGNEDDLYYVDVDMNALEIEAFEGGEGKKYELAVTYYEYDKKGEIETVASNAKVFTVQAEPKSNPLTPDSIVINTSGSFSNKNADGVPMYRHSWEGRTTKAKIAANDTGLYVAASIYDDWNRKYDNTTGELRFYSSNPQVADVDLYDGKFTPYEVGSVRINVYVADDATGKETFAGSVTVKVLAERKPSKITISDSSKTTQDLYSHIVVGTTWEDTEKNGEVVLGLKSLDNDGYDEWVFDVSDGDRTDNITTPMDIEWVTYYVKVIDNHGEEMTGLGYADFTMDENAKKYFELDEEVEHVWNSAGKALGYPIDVWNADVDVVEAISNSDNYKRASVTLHGVFGLEANEKTSQKLSVTLRKPVDEVVDDYTIETTAANNGMESSDYAAFVSVYGLSKNDVPVWAFDEFVYAPTDIKTFVGEMNKLDEDTKAATAASGTTLVYTITKNGKIVKALGTGEAKAASGSSVVTSIINGETMDATNDSYITFNNTTNVEVGNKVLSTTITNASGDYVLTLYEIDGVTKDGKTTFKSAKAANCTMSVNAGKVEFKATPVKIAVDASKFTDDLGNRLQWTADSDVRDVIVECFNMQLGGRTDGTFWGHVVEEDLDMLFNVRINGNTMYVKSIKVFVPVDNDFVAIETQVGWTITINE